MGKRKPQSGGSHSARARQEAPSEQAATLKDLLSGETIAKLREQAEQLKTAELKRKEDERQRAEEARLAEQKKLEGNFEYLLNNSKMDWRSFKS